MVVILKITIYGPVRLSCLGDLLLVNAPSFLIKWDIVLLRATSRWKREAELEIAVSVRTMPDLTWPMSDEIFTLLAE